MKAPWSGQLSAAKTGWLVMLLFFGWLAYLLVPAPKPEAKPAPTLAKPPPSRLVALGLPDNPDLEQLPEFFGLYADQAEWKNDKTIFAYWNPGSNSYAYFFEATRVKGAYYFKILPEQIVGEDEVVQSGLYWSAKISDASPIRFIHKFAPPRIIVPVPVPPIYAGVYQDNSATQSVQAPELIKPPPPELKLPPLDVEQKK